MKATVVTFLCIMLLFNSCSSDVKVKTDKKIKNDLKDDNLNGKVKLIKETAYDVVEKFGKIEKAEKSVSFNSLYDDKGNRIETNWYKPDGSLDEKTSYKQDEKGNLIEEICYKSDGSLKSKITPKYDEKGNLIERSEYKTDGKLD